MVNGKLNVIYLFVITSSLLPDLAASQSVTRFSDSVKYDEFLYLDNSTCVNNGCNKFSGYKVCHNCCTCTCNYGSYLSSKGKCIANENIVKDCKFSIGEDPYADLLTIMTPALMKKGQKIAYCQDTWSRCSTVATDCIIDSSKTVYDNDKWRKLWPLGSLVDFEIVKKPGDSDSLVWTSNGCDEQKYDGLLISLQVKCQVHTVAKKVSSCLIFKFPGTFVVGEDILIQTNCTMPAKTLQPASSEVQTTLPTTHSTKVVTLTSKETQSTTVITNLTSQNVLSTAHPSKENQKQPKHDLFLSISLPMGALLLVSLILTGIVVIRKRRKSSADHISKREEDTSTVTANSSVSQTPTVFAMDFNGDLSEGARKMNADVHFPLSERPPLFTVSVPEGFYDEPISEATTSLRDVSPDVDTRGEIAANMDARYATVMNTASSPEKSAKIKSMAKNSTDFDDSVDGDTIWLQNSFSHYSEPYEEGGSTDVIYDELDAGVRDTYNAATSDGKMGEPIYMLYEPIHS